MFSEFEKNVFRRRGHELFFRDGKIKLCDSDDIGRSIVYDDGKGIIAIDGGTDVTGKVNIIILEDEIL